MSTTTDISLLRRFEPVIHYTKGEHFFPMDVEPYIRACSLWVQRPGEEAVCLIEPGELTVANLPQPYPDEFGAVHFLKIANPLTPAELAAYSLKKRFSELSSRNGRDIFRAGQGRLARVGYVSRFTDAIFSLSLLARGRVPGDTAAAAAITYDRLMKEADDTAYPYYSRVLRQDGWTILQYWFFYLFNNWRSGFYGLNDHEADWETICIYLAETKEGNLQPEWVAFASHDNVGDDLRRHWDDPEMEKIGEHPVIYAGAGSHASYYTAGEYLTEVEVAFMAPVARVAGRIQNFWREKLRQFENEEERSVQNGEVHLFSVPFVDYARGDGMIIGPGQDKKWATPRLLDPVPAWASGYRGLWGLYTRDPLGGENAPSGPIYNRNGTVRRSWSDPLGWAGLNKIPPPRQALNTAIEQQAEVKARQETLQTDIEVRTAKLKRMSIETAAMRGHPHLGELYQTRQQVINQLSGEVSELRAQLTMEQALFESLETYAHQLWAGNRGPLRDHIRRAHQPASREELRLGRVAEFWAAISIGLTLIGFVALMAFGRDYLLWGLVGIFSLFVFIESGFRGRLTNVVTSLATSLSLVATLVLLYEFFWPIVSVIVLLVGGYILLDNLRELWA